MDHIVKKLSEIEHAAEAVVEHAELEKSELKNAFKMNAICLTNNLKITPKRS